MPNFLKTNLIAIVVCLVCTLIAAGAAVYFVKQATQESKAAAVKMAEELKVAEASLAKSNTEAASLKEALDKEQALNAELKKAMAESELELEQLRGSLRAATSAASRISKANTAKTQRSSGCREGTAKSSKERLSALQKKEAEILSRENELKEKQRKLDESQNKHAAEKRKLMLQNSEYRWPHAAEPANKQ